MKKHKKAVWRTLGILAAVILISLICIWPTGTALTKYPGRYDAYTESYEEIMEQAGTRDIFIPDLTEFSGEGVRTGYRMVMDSQFVWAKPDYCEVSVDVEKDGRLWQYYFIRLAGEPSAEGTLLEYKGVTWISLPDENQIKLGDTWYRAAYRFEDGVFLDALTEFIIDQYLASL